MIPKNDFKKRMTFEEANALLREKTKDSPFWRIVREKAVARLRESNPEEIGSSDIACAATELVQSCEILLPGRYKLIARQSQLPYFVRVDHLGGAYISSAAEYAGRGPLGGQTINAVDIHEYFEVPYATRELQEGPCGKSTSK